jgi:hypothetical protein
MHWTPLSIQTPAPLPPTLRASNCKSARALEPRRSLVGHREHHHPSVPSPTPISNPASTSLCYTSMVPPGRFPPDWSSCESNSSVALRFLRHLCEVKHEYEAAAIPVVFSDFSRDLAIHSYPIAAGAATGTLTVSDNASNSPQTVALSGTGSGPAPSIGLGVASSGSASAAVTAGATAAYILSIGGSGMAGTASLTCTGAATGATRSVPASVPLNATTASTFNVSVSTTARSLVLFTPVRPTPWLLALALLASLALLLTTASAQHSRRWRLAPLMALVLCACGGGSTSMQNPNGTSAGTYTLVVTAKSGSTTQTQSLTLTVQ